MVYRLQEPSGGLRRRSLKPQILRLPKPAEVAKHLIRAPGTLNQASTECVTTWVNNGLLDLQPSSDYRLLQATGLVSSPFVSL
jgi:hypothetical protein